LAALYAFSRSEAGNSSLQSKHGDFSLKISNQKIRVRVKHILQHAFLVFCACMCALGHGGDDVCCRSVALPRLASRLIKPCLVSLAPSLTDMRTGFWPQGHVCRAVWYAGCFVSIMTLTRPRAGQTTSPRCRIRKKIFTFSLFYYFLFILYLYVHYMYIRRHLSMVVRYDIVS
jgi:hypothetical protein